MPAIYHDTREMLFPTIEGNDAAWDHAVKRIFSGLRDVRPKNRWKDTDMRDAYVMLRWAELGNMPPATKLIATIIAPKVQTRLPYEYKGSSRSS